jgi:putative holliday junction resolvase
LRSLGLDVGDRRIGVAISDALSLLASPLTVLERKNEAFDIEAILRIVKENQVGLIIVGLPRSMNGTIGPQAEKVKAFTQKLTELSLVPVEYRDERLTTVAAKRLLQEANTKKSSKFKKIGYDAAAAAIILQSYLNESKPLEWPPEENNQ